jgi:hypothetical protein
VASLNERHFAKEGRNGRDPSTTAVDSSIRDERVGERVDARQIVSKFGRQVMATGERVGRDVRDLGLLAVGPNEDLERKVERRQWRGIHDRRAGLGIAEENQSRGTKVEPDVARFLSLIDDVKKLESFIVQQRQECGDRLFDRTRTPFRDDVGVVFVRRHDSRVSFGATDLEFASLRLERCRDIRFRFLLHAGS